MSKLKPGADVKIKIVLPLPVADYLNVLVAVHDTNKRVICRAAKEVTADYDTDIFVIDGVELDTCYVQLLAEHTKNARPGNYYCEVWTQETDLEWKTLIFNDKTTDANFLFTLLESPQKNADIS